MTISITTTLLILLAITCYSSAFTHLLLHIIRKQLPKRTLMMSILLVGLLAHFFLIAPQIHTTSGLNFNIFNMLSLTGWLMLTLTVILNTYRPVLSLNLLAIPFALGGLLIGTYWQAPYQPAQLGTGIKLHIMLSLLAYCVLFMASIQSVLLWFQTRELKQKSIHHLWVNVLPPLQTMESVLFDVIFIGFALLTGALLFGAIYVDNLLTQHLFHKTVFSIISWLIFGALIIGRVRLGWRGARAVTFTLWGFALLFLGFLGSKFVLEMLLGRVG